MNKINNIIKIVVLLAVISSCSRQSKIESIFIAEKNERVQRTSFAELDNTVSM